MRILMSGYHCPGRYNVVSIFVDRIEVSRPFLHEVAAPALFRVLTGAGFTIMACCIHEEEHYILWLLE